MKNIAVLVSGGGTNLQALLDAYDDGRLFGRINLVVSDNEESFALKRAISRGIAAIRFSRGEFEGGGSALLKSLKESCIDIVVLAGFLSRVPDAIVDEYEGRIINVHPSLLPRYGGKGFYGDRVHKAVLESGDEFSGATVHHVDRGIDTGEVMVQSKVSVEPGDTVETLGMRVRNVEHSIIVEAVNRLCEE
jgi:phosphoribosylglycinamide formyltransferase 1